MLKTLFTYELKYLVRNKTLLILSFALFIITGYALYNGNIVYSKQMTVINSIKSSDSLSHSDISQRLHPDTLKKLEKTDMWTYNRLTKASHALFNNHSVYWKPHALSRINIGNRDIYPYYQEIMPVSLYMRLFKNEISNPNALLTGNIDFSYVIIFIFPLFIIALLFNFSSQNEENGIQPFLFANTSSLKKIVLTRLLFYAALVLTILIVLFILTYILLFNEQQDVILFKLFLQSLLFTLFWVGICYAVNRLRRSSVFNITVLISVWLVLSVLIPSVANQWAAYKYPINTEEISKNMRRVQIKDDTAAFTPILNKFFGMYPQYKNSDTSQTDLFFKAYLAQGQLSDLKGDSLLNEMTDKILQKQNFLTSISYLNPSMYLQNTFTDHTETNLIHYVDYLRKVQLYNGKLRAHYFKKFFTGDNKMDAIYFQIKPRWGEQ